MENDGFVVSYACTSNLSVSLSSALCMSGFYTDQSHTSTEYRIEIVERSVSPNVKFPLSLNSEY